MTVPVDTFSFHTPRPVQSQHIASGFSLPNAALATIAVAALISLAVCNSAQACAPGSPPTAALNVGSAAPCTSSS